MSDARLERSADELVLELTQERDAARKTINERREAEDRGADDLEIAEYERIARALAAAELDAYAEAHRIGDHYLYMHGLNPPGFDQEAFDTDVAELRKLPPGAEFRARLAAPEAPAKHGKSPERRSAEFTIEQLERLDELLNERAELLEERKRKQDRGPMPDHLTHQGIGRVFSLSHTSVWRVEKVRNMALDAKGWDLTVLTSKPQFCADNGRRYFPTDRMAREALGLRRSS